MTGRELAARVGLELGRQYFLGVMLTDNAPEDVRAFAEKRFPRSTVGEGLKPFAGRPHVKLRVVRCLVGREVARAARQRDVV